jgi:DNA polymerase-3 subunit delta
MFYLFHGADDLSLAETVIGLRERLFEADSMAELNYSDLDGRRIGLGELRETAEALPFMGDRRLVVVRGLVERCNPRGGDGGRKALSEGIIEMLSQLPPTTRLVLVEDKLHGNNPVLKWAGRWLAAQPHPEAAALIRKFEPPSPDRLPRWLVERAKTRGGRIEMPAATALADALVREGTIDLRRADSELEKLLTYAGTRAVTPEDVALLITPVSLERIFDLIDALAGRDGPAAMTLLHRFLDNSEPPMRILALVARQFRMLAMTHALTAEGLAPTEIRARLAVPAFVANKLSGQARRFSPAFVDSALRRLRDIDHQIKTGRVDAVLALDLFVAGVCGARR